MQAKTITIAELRKSGHTLKMARKLDQPFWNTVRAALEHKEVPNKKPTNV